MSSSESLDSDDTLPSTSTIEPRVQADAAGERAIAELRELSARTSLCLEATLGQGGMGVVHLATQATVGRKVAVKRLRDEHRSASNTMQLLREAWITGALEHPNVVPIYDVTLDSDGQAVIVLRRIEGVDWASLIQEPELVARRFGATDVLGWHLRIFAQVANAVHFAHQRGIIHRDIKPENVMVGELGEVYLLDWGVACSLADDGTGRLPLAATATAVAGTPAYMAPEMWSGDPARIGTWVDVYLLGGVLYELITGGPPHDGKTINELRASSAKLPPMPSEGAAPEGIIELCRRALSPNIAERPASALELRREVERFLERRGAELLVEEADVGRHRLGEALARPDRERAIIYGLFGGCRFGYEQALHRSPDLNAARTGLVAATVLMVEYELGAGDSKAAAALVAGLPNPPAALLARLAEAERAHAAAEEKRRKLEALGREHDTSVGQRTRLFIGIAIGLLWTLQPLGTYFFGTWVTSHQRMLVYSAILLAAAVGIGIWARESLTGTAFNRAILVMIIATPTYQILMYLGCMLLHFDVTQTEVIHLFLWSIMCTALAGSNDRRFAWPALAFAAGWLAAAHWPAQRKLFFSAGNLILLVTVIVMWLPGLRGGLFRPRAERR